MIKFIEKILASLAKKILKKYQPEIIGITGSVGKTSTKEAIFTVLKNKYNARANPGNYNNELGVPLTIIDSKTAGRNFLRWLPVFFKAWKLILKKDKNYPEILVLEMAAAHSGDIKYLINIAPCKVGVVTTVGPSHMEFFKDIKNVIKEKEKIVTHIKNGWAVLNADDDLVMSIQKNTRAKVLTYGLSKNADVCAQDINYEADGSGVSCKIIINNQQSIINNKKNNADFKNVLSSGQMSSILAAISVGLIYDIPLAQAVSSLKDFRFPSGRLNLIKGIKNTFIIDDTYNSSPKAVKVALEVLSRIECAGRRWAVLGDMLELGGLTETTHQEVGEWVKQFKVDILICVGEKMTTAAQVAENGELALVKEKVICFDNSDEVKKFIQNEISQGDLILVKGSQGMRMEKIVKEIMAEPQRAEELLVRQNKKWLRK